MTGYRPARLPEGELACKGAQRRKHPFTRWRGKGERMNSEMHRHSVQSFNPSMPAFRASALQARIATEALIDFGQRPDSLDGRAFLQLWELAHSQCENRMSRVDDLGEHLARIHTAGPEDRDVLHLYVFREEELLISQSSASGRGHLADTVRLAAALIRPVLTSGTWVFAVQEHHGAGRCGHATLSATRIV